ncbi:hypothetical protein RALBFv3_09355 [Ralstonia solanacearum]|nr:hypothetical protein RALBFv3_09355 [Ralstonia solanacearum]
MGVMPVPPGKAEIDDLYDAVTIQSNVLRLNVTMNDACRVYVSQPAGNLPEDFHVFIPRHILTDLQVLTRYEFQNQRCFTAPILKGDNVK